MNTQRTAETMYQGSLHREGDVQRGEREGRPWKQKGIVVCGGAGGGAGQIEKHGGWWLVAGGRPGCVLEGSDFILGFTLRLFHALKCYEANSSLI